MVEVEKLYLFENVQFDMLFSYPEHLARYHTNGICRESELAKDSIRINKLCII